MHLIEILKNYWFSEKEAQVYLACLELNIAPASTIARFCNEKRLATYDVLKQLQKRWIVSEFEQNKVHVYSVISPERLIEMRKLETEVILNKMSAALPEFFDLKNNISQFPKIQFFEWFDGMLQIYKDHEKSTTELLSFLGPDAIPADIKKYLREHHVIKARKNKVFARVICSDDKSAQDFQARDGVLFRESLIIKDPLLKLSTEIVAYGPGKVSITIFKKNTVSGTIINNNEFYDSMVAIFEHIWHIHQSNKQK